MLDPTLFLSITISLGMIITPLSITYKKIHVIYSSITSFFLFSFLRSNPIQYPPIQFSHTLLTLLSLPFSHPNRSTPSVTRTILADSLTLSVSLFACSKKLEVLKLGLTLRSLDKKRNGFRVLRSLLLRLFAEKKKKRWKWIASKEPNFFYLLFHISWKLRRLKKSLLSCTFHIFFPLFAYIWLSSVWLLRKWKTRF